MPTTGACRRRAPASFLLSLSWMRAISATWPADRLHRIERRADPGRSSRSRRRGSDASARRWHSADPHPSMSARRPRSSPACSRQTHDAQRRHRLARPRFADDREHLAATNVETDPSTALTRPASVANVVRRLRTESSTSESAGAAIEASSPPRREAARCSSPHLGSSVSRKPSPTRTNASTVRKIANAGKRMRRRWPSALGIADHQPHAGVGNCGPTPMNEPTRPGSPRRWRSCRRR